MPRSLLTPLLVLLLAATSAACRDDAPPSSADAGADPEDYSDIDPADYDPPCPRLSDASYVRNGNLVGTLTWWPAEVVAGCIPVAHSPEGTDDIDGDQEEDILWRAADTWTEAAAGCGVPLCFEDAGLVDIDEGLGYDNEGGPNYNLVAYIDDAEDWDSRNNPIAIASTTYTQVVRTGRIVDADIEVNDASWRFTQSDPVPVTAFDLESILLHELGHLIGFDHTTDKTSVMYPSEEQTSIDLKRELSADDVDGVCEAFSCYE